MPSPPKPWERNGSAVPAPASTGAPQGPAPSSASAPVPSSASTSIPTVPARPPALAVPSSLAQTPFSGAANGAYGAPYAGGAYSAPYTSYSPYNRMGGASYGSSYSPYGMGSMYGGAGGYAGVGGYGGAGGYGYSPYGGMNSMYPGGGMYPGAAPPFGDPGMPSLTQTLEATTAQTFGLLHALVQTFGSVAQMLESTFAATHTSFFAMLGVVDQLGALRTALGSVLGLFGLVRWARDTLAGRAPPSALRGEFREFVAGRPPAPRASKKPLVIFLLAVLGVPYAMHRLVRALLARQAAAAQAAGALPPLEPAQLEFARALYPFEASSPAELALRENEIVAIMGKLDPATGAEVDPRIEVEGSEWWKGRTREGREGWFPRKFVQVIERRQPQLGDTPVPEAKKVE